MAKKNWIIAAALAFGTTGALAPVEAFGQSKETRAARAREANRDAKEKNEQVRFRELPKGVQETFEKARKDATVLSYWHVVRDGKEFYRAIVDTRGTNTVLRAKPGGELLTKEDAGDEADDAVASKSKGVKRTARLARDETEGDIVDFDRLPGEAKTEIGRLAKGDKVDEVVKYKHRGRTMYRAEVGEGRYTRYIRVSEDGKVDGVRGDIDPGEKVDFNRLPGEVKSKIGALAKSGKVDEVIEYKRGGKTYYQAEVDPQGSGKSYFFTVDDNGREVEGLPRFD
jgi:hypothetical protein